MRACSCEYTPTSRCLHVHTVGRVCLSAERVHIVRCTHKCVFRYVCVHMFFTRTNEIASYSVQVASAASLLLPLPSSQLSSAQHEARGCYLRISCKTSRDNLKPATFCKHAMSYSGNFHGIRLASCPQLREILQATGSPNRCCSLIRTSMLGRKLHSQLCLNKFCENLRGAWPHRSEMAVIRVM